MRRYDLIFSMGGSCHCSQSLRAAGLQLTSFPFDWVGGPPMPDKAAFLTAGFPGWFEAENLRPVDTPHKTVRNIALVDKWGFLSVHDFHRGTPIEQELPVVQAKYRRRVDRLMRLIEGSRRVLIAYFVAPGLPVTTPEELSGVVRPVMTGKWPGVNFDFLLMRPGRTGRKEPQVTESADGVRTAVFDDTDWPTPGWHPDLDLIAKWLKSEYSVADYRTDDERRSYAKKARQTKYASMNAKGPFSYLVNCWQYRLYRHLHKKLSARGIV